MTEDIIPMGWFRFDSPHSCIQRLTLEVVQNVEAGKTMVDFL